MIKRLLIKIKIFDFIKLEENLINKIEFIDLPGPDRKNNTFNEQKYYEKILRFSNCCIYINEPKTINDELSVNRMRDQYISDKGKVFINLRPNFIKTCLFLINKSDTLEEEKDKDKIIDNLIKIIPENNISKNNINISFFSGKSFIEFLDYYNKYVYNMETNPLYLMKCLHHDWSANILYLNNFNYYIINKIADKIEEKFDLNLEQEIEVPNTFYNKLKSAINTIYRDKYKSITDEDEDKIIEKLYIIYTQLKNKNFDNTNYSPSFFDTLKKVIIYSETLHNNNLNNAIKQFFSYADELFKKEIKKEDENEREENKNKCNFIKKTLIPKTKDLFIQKQKKIINIIQLCKYKCMDIFENEIKNIDQRLEETEKDVEKAAKKLEEKIQKELEEMSKEQENEVKLLLNEIENLLKENINKYYEQKNISQTKINTNKGITMKMIISLFSSTISGVAVRTGLVLVGETMLYGAAAGASAAVGTTLSSSLAGALLGPLGIAIGFGVGIAISLGTFLIHWFSKSKRYKNGIEEYQKTLSKKLEDYQNSFENDFIVLKDSIINELNIRVEILLKEINTIDKNKWEEIKENYNKQKRLIKLKIEKNLNN